MSVYLTDRAIYYQLAKIGPERTRLQTLRAVIRFVVQAVGVLLILLVILGAPSQMPTILGLAGAGLTVYRASHWPQSSICKHLRDRGPFF
jgi:hypothetical protein